MTKEQFLKDYYCEFSHGPISTSYHFVTKVFRREGNIEVDSVIIKYKIRETNEWIADSHAQTSCTPWNEIDFIEKNKRVQLFLLVQNANIQDYYPSDKALTPDISDMYRK